MLGEDRCDRAATSARSPLPLIEVRHAANPPFPARRRDCGAVTIAPARAAEFRDFDRATFNAAGRPTLVDVHAWWCPVCASQGRTIKAATAAPQYDKLLVLKLNYDKQKSEWQSFGVTKQATLIAFKGGHEVSRLSYQTSKDKIAAVLDSTVN